jgi:hypothetical protein
MLKRLMIMEIGFDLKIRYLGIFRGALKKKLSTMLLSFNLLSTCKTV